MGMLNQLMEANLSDIGFDDHADVLALQFFLQRLIMLRINESRDPEKELSEWKEAAEKQNNYEMGFLSQLIDSSGPNVGLNLINSCSARTSFVEELEKNFRGTN
jgi:hypothetical protein